MDPRDAHGNMLANRRRQVFGVGVNAPAGTPSKPIAWCGDELEPAGPAERRAHPHATPNRAPRPVEKQ